MIILVSLAVHVVSLVLGRTILSDWRWEHHPVHSAIEMAGAGIALAVAWMLVTLESRGEGGNFNVRIAGALIGMGVLDGIHSLVHAGNCFVWLHSIATFAGGILFALVWLPRRWSIWRITRWPVMVLVISLIIGFVSLSVPHRLPLMVSEGAFSAGARALNKGGGVLLLAAAVRLILEWRARRNTDDLLFCLHCTLFGAAAIMFEQSALWDVPWWGWHLLRLMAYLVALLFMMLTEQQALDRIIAIRHELHELHATLEAAPVGIVVANERGEIVFANETLLRELGWSHDELLNQKVEVLIPEHLRDHHLLLRDEYFRNPTRRRSRTLTALRNDGTEIPIDLSLSPLRTDDGLFVLGAIVDVTERWQADQERERYTTELAHEVQLRRATEEHLRKSNEDLQQFAYVASHDLQEPLRAVAGYCDLLESSCREQLNDEGHGFLRHAVEGAHRMQSLISDLLEYSRVGTRGHSFTEIAARDLFDGALLNLE
ncbi:MAG: PAS domain S-box protein, partial [Planctomycetaceae bacterium]|nr:PAS domain S-box protein [Planctomycetaceae bacterium]